MSPQQRSPRFTDGIYVPGGWFISDASFTEGCDEVNYQTLTPGRSMYFLTHYVQFSSEGVQFSEVGLYSLRLRGSAEAYFVQIRVDLRTRVAHAQSTSCLQSTIALGARVARVWCVTVPRYGQGGTRAHGSLPASTHAKRTCKQHVSCAVWWEPLL